MKWFPFLLLLKEESSVSLAVSFLEDPSVPSCCAGCSLGLPWWTWAEARLLCCLASCAAGRNGTGGGLPRRLPLLPGKRGITGPVGSRRGVCGLGLVLQVTSHTCLSFNQNLLSADELRHGKLDTRLGAGNRCYCILSLSDMIPHPPRAVVLQQSNMASKLQLQAVLPLQNQRPAGQTHFLQDKHVCMMSTKRGLSLQMFS